MQLRVQSTKFVFTINNYGVEEQDKVINIVNGFSGNVRYLIAETEHDSSEDLLNGLTPHIQGYVHFINKVDRNRLSNWLNKKAHIEVAKGSDMENKKYCSKENKIIIEYGEIEKSKKELKDLECLQRIHDMEVLENEEFKLKYPRYFEINYKRKEEFRFNFLANNLKIYNGSLKKKNIWIWGPPGTGKSKCAWTGLDLFKIYSKPFNKWWNGFKPSITKRIILEDYPQMPEGNVLVQKMKIWSDRYPFVAETKGSHFAISPDYQFIVTSNYPISLCFNSIDDINAIKRRFTEWEFTDDSETLDHFIARII